MLSFLNYVIIYNLCTYLAPKCGPNEEFLWLGTDCLTCDNYKHPICKDLPREGCFCKKGYVRHNKECIPVEKCPKCT